MAGQRCCLRREEVPHCGRWLIRHTAAAVLTRPQKLEDVNDDAEARKRGFPKGGSFKLLKRDIVLVSESESAAAREKFAAERAQKVTV